MFYKKKLKKNMEFFQIFVNVLAFSNIVNSYHINPLKSKVQNLNHKSLSKISYKSTISKLS